MSRLPLIEPGTAGKVTEELFAAALCSAFFIDVMGSTSVFTASPSIGGALGLTPGRSGGPGSARSVRTIVMRAGSAMATKLECACGQL